MSLFPSKCAIEKCKNTATETVYVTDWTGDINVGIIPVCQFHRAESNGKVHPKHVKSGTDIEWLNTKPKTLKEECHQTVFAVFNALKKAKDGEMVPATPKIADILQELYSSGYSAQLAATTANWPTWPESDLEEEDDGWDYSWQQVPEVKPHKTHKMAKATTKPTKNTIPPEPPTRRLVKKAKP